jgi:type IV secretion system protein TrbL
MFWNLFDIMVYCVAAVVVVVAYFVMAIQEFFLALEWTVMRLAVYVALPFASLAATSFVAEKAIGYIAATGLRLFVLGMVIALAAVAMQVIAAVAGVTLALAFGFILLSVTLVIVAWTFPKKAAGLVNGGPVLSGSEALLGLYAAARLGMAAVSLGASAVAGISRLAGTITGAGGGAAGTGGTGNAGGGSTGPAPTRGYPGGPQGGAGGGGSTFGTQASWQGSRRYHSQGAAAAAWVNTGSAPTQAGQRFTTGPNFSSAGSRTSPPADGPGYDASKLAHLSAEDMKTYLELRKGR